VQQTLGENPNVEDTARATDLALKRLERDLGRGEVDEELLRELGWTPERLSEFVERMQNQLQQLKSTEDDHCRNPAKASDRGTPGEP